MLPALLKALHGQRRKDDFQVCFLLDGCKDASERVIRDYIQAVGMAASIAFAEPSVDPVLIGNAGRARRAAMAVGIEQTRHCPDAVLLATDADSIPAYDWVTRGVATLREVDVVTGRIIRRDGALDPTQDRVEAYYDRLYALRRRLDPVPWECDAGHHYTGGANMGFRAAAYIAIGGFRDLATGEDATIIDDAGRAGLRVRRDPALIVETSSRRDGRTLGGLASILRAQECGDDPIVSDPARAAWQYRAHALAREAFSCAKTRGALRSVIGLDVDHLRGVARDCPNAEAFATRVVPAAPGADRSLSLAQAECALAQLEAEPVIGAT